MSRSYSSELVRLALFSQEIVAAATIEAELGVGEATLVQND